MTSKRLHIDQIIDDAPIRRIHIDVLAICILVGLVAGFDNQALAFTAPSMAKAWGTTVASFAPVFGTGLAGMLFGSLIFGELADRLGRRFVFVAATLLLFVSTITIPLTEATRQLMILRFVAGLGIGGLPPVMASLVSEYAPKRYRATFGNWAFAGIPCGGFLGGLLASFMMQRFGWHSVYWVGGLTTLVVSAAAFLALPESLAFLLHQRDGRQRLRLVFAALAPGQVIEDDTELVSRMNEKVKTSIVSAFTEGRARMTVLFWISEAILLMGYYFLVNWIPSLLARSGLPMQMAILGSVALNLGGILFGLVIGLLCDRFGARLVMGATFLLGGIALFTATQAGGNVVLMMGAVFLAGGAWIAGQAGMVVLIAANYPVAIRSLSVGWALMIGRVGAVASPAIVSIPIGLGWTPKDILFLPILPAIIAAICVIFAKSNWRGAEAQAISK